MRKINLSRLILFFPVLILLSGCQAVRSRIEQELWERSGVAEDFSYKQYRQMEEANALDADGLYHSEIVEQSLSESKPKEGTIHVSFARNDYLQFEFFHDEGMKEALDTTDCWMNPGDPIYVSDAQLKNPRSTLYSFSAFRIRSIDEKGAPELLTEVNEIPGLLFRIPEDFSGTDISIIPIGAYQNRRISLNAVYVHPDGNESVLENGYWEVNGKRYGNGVIELNPMESYRVVYDYHLYQDDWYFAGSTPDSYCDKSSDAVITFLAEPSDEPFVSYTVRLHPYTSMVIQNGVSFQNPVDSILDSAATIFRNRSVIETQNIVELVQVNGITNVNNFSDTEITLSNLKVGDEILIRVPEKLKVISDDLPLPHSVHKEQSSREYRFAIPDSDERELQLTVNERNSDMEGVFHELSIERGTLELYDQSGVRYLEGSELPAESEKVTVVITPEKNYCVYGKNIKNNVYRAVMKYSEFSADFSAILAEHPIRPGIIVTLDTEDDLGNCAFWTGTELINGTVVLREDQDLQFDYVLDPESGYEIVLTQEEREQLVNVWSPYAASRQLEVTEALQGKTLRCRDYVTLQEGVKTDVIEDLY